MGATSDSIHRLNPDDALRSLHSRITGLTTSEAELRAREFGPNALARPRQRSAAAHLLAQFTHFFALILWTAAGLAVIAETKSPGSGMATLAVAIVAVILVNGLFSFWQERRAYHALEALQRLLPSTVRVRRDGITRELSVTALVPGDVIALAEGDQVPADCRLIEAFDMRIDNATLTGESVPRGRDARPDLEPTHDIRAQQSNMVLTGTAVAAGEGLAVVVVTGMRTEFGQIAHLTQTAPERVAPLQREIARLSRLIALLSVKFTTYVLTSNVPELVPYLAFVLLRIPLPLTIIQVFAVDLGTDMVPALGLGAEPPDPEVMSRSPRSQQNPLIDYGLLGRAYLLLGVVEAAAAMAAYAVVLKAGEWHWGQTLAASDPLYLRATTACLTAVVITQAANVFACRSETNHVVAKGLLSNRLLIAGVLFELLLIGGIDYTSLGHRVFGTANIGWAPWAVALPFAAALLVLDGLWKRHRGRESRSVSA